jgi:Recombination endonuclease VII
MTMKEPVCIDCRKEGVTTVRPIAEGCGPRSPRCLTHKRAVKRRRRTQAHGRMVGANYAMTPEQYWVLYEFQGGVCFICRKATGAARHLAVEHEHGKAGCEHPPERGCPRCWRGLACKRCNRLIAYMDTDTLVRAILFLTDPPARQLFAP